MHAETGKGAPISHTPPQDGVAILAQKLHDNMLHFMFGVDNPPTAQEISARIQEQVGTTLIHAGVDVDAICEYLSDIDAYIIRFYHRADTKGAREFLDSVISRTRALEGSASIKKPQTLSSPQEAKNPLTTDNLSRDASSKKRSKLSRTAGQTLMPQNARDLFANSHLNNRHPVQMQILQKILSDISQKGKKTGYIHEPARVGKTAIYIDFIRHYFHYLCDEMGLGKRVFFVVPSVVLMEQVPGEIEKFFPQVSVGAYYGREKKLNADVVVLTYTSFNVLVEKGAINPANKECLILDEAHEALSDLRQDFIGRFDQSIRLGGTATSELGDERTVESLLQHEYHRMSIVQAIEYELIAPYWVIYVLTKTDISGVKIMNGDLSDRQLSAKINNRERNALVIELYRKIFDGKKAIAYCGTIDHSQDLSREFNMAGVRATSIDSDAGYDDTSVQAFRRGDYKVATNPFKLVQGFDDPEVEVIFAVRPSFSPRVVGQSRPRGQTLRSGKACSYIVELVDPSADRFPLLYEEFVLWDHRKTTGNHDFSLEELRRIIREKIEQNGDLLEIPREICGCPIAADTESIKQLFYTREAASHAELRRRGITPGDPPDDHASFSEFEQYANMQKSWVTKKIFSIINRKGLKYYTTIKRYKVGTQRIREYMPPEIFEYIFTAYEAKFPSWQRPSRPFSRNALLHETMRQKKTGDKKVYEFSLRDLAEKLRCDISFLEAYGIDFFRENEISFSFHTYTYTGSIALDELMTYIEKKKQEEIPIADIARYHGGNEDALTSQLFEFFNEHDISCARLDKGFIHLDDWLSAEKNIS